MRQVKRAGVAKGQAFGKPAGTHSHRCQVQLESCLSHSTPHLASLLLQLVAPAIAGRGNFPRGRGCSDCQYYLKRSCCCSHKQFATLTSRGNSIIHRQPDSSSMELFQKQCEKQTSCCAFFWRSLFALVWNYSSKEGVREGEGQRAVLLVQSSCIKIGVCLELEQVQAQSIFQRRLPISVSTIDSYGYTAIVLHL